VSNDTFILNVRPRAAKCGQQFLKMELQLKATFIKQSSAIDAVTISTGALATVDLTIFAAS
jgi:hypothetical protein